MLLERHAPHGLEFNLHLVNVMLLLAKEDSRSRGKASRGRTC